ncbi:MAG TPA: hypothetical protein VGC15_15030 [Acetobacteraceae bacterium]
MATHFRITYTAGMKRILPFLLLPFFALPAAAQLSGGSGGIRPTPGTSPKASTVKREAPPPAVPGARAEPTAVAPADRSAADLPPNEALFDAINRGDLATAKDAINHGADLNGTNVLGLTPLELAVDLGRNEISFLLLTLRGGNGYTTSSGPAPATPQGRAAAARAEREAARVSARQTRAERDAVAARPGAGPSLQAPRLFAGQGGTPVPQAGFLGFDAAR